MRSVNRAGIDLIKSFEGLVDGNPRTVNLDPYIDPVGIYTIGWGHAIKYGNGFLSKHTPHAPRVAAELYPEGITRAEAEALLQSDILSHSLPVEGLLTVPLTDNQFAAVVSFTFNLGVGAFRRSALRRWLNAGRFDLAAAEFPKWNKAGGKVLKGLTRRRRAEAALFLAA